MFVIVSTVSITARLAFRSKSSELFQKHFFENVVNDLKTPFLPDYFSEKVRSSGAGTEVFQQDGRQ